MGSIKTGVLPIIAILMVVRLPTSSLNLMNEDTVGIPKSDFRFKRDREAITSEEICANFVVNLPGLCKAVKSGFAWAFGSSAAAYIYDICGAVTSDGSLAKRSLSRTSDSENEGEYWTAPGHISPGEAEHFLQAFNPDSPFIPPTNEVKFESFQRSFFTSFNATTTCLRVVEKTTKMCNLFLGHSIAHHLRDFAWLCYFTPDPLGICYKMVSNLGNICRITVRDVATSNHSIDAGNNETDLTTDSSRDLNSAADTCKSLTPTLGATCEYFGGAFNVFFGDTVGDGFDQFCSTYFDGLKNLFPRVGGELGRLGAKLSLVLSKEKSAKLTNPVRNSFEGRKGVLATVKGVLDGGVLKTCPCDGLVRLFAPACQGLLGKHGGRRLEKLTWVCDVAGQLGGVCRLAVLSTARVCSVDTRNCDEQLPLSNFTCESRPDGFYEDPQYSCANYFFHCHNQSKSVRGCYEGEQSVYIAEDNNCRNKLDVPKCRSILSPCPPEPDKIIRPKINPRKISCDPSIPVNGTASMVNHQEIRSTKIERYTEEELYFNCTGLKDGRYSNPQVTCSSVFFECRNGELFKFACDYDFHVYTEKKNWFGMQSAKCVPRASVPGCQLPSCPAYHPLRLTCDPWSEPPPESYNSAYYKFNCTGKPRGVYSDPYNKCADYFYVCEDNNAVGLKMRCDLFQEGLPYVFDEERFLCVLKEEVNHCTDYLQPCPEGHPLRKNQV